MGTRRLTRGQVTKLPEVDQTPGPSAYTSLLSGRNWQGVRGVLAPSTAHWSRRPQLPTLSSRGGRRPHDRLYLGKEIYMFIYRRGTIPLAGI